jgi:hypothetical protein
VSEKFQMSHARLRLTRLTCSCLIFLGCTKLEDPNQWFGAANAGGSSPVGAAGGQSQAGGGASGQATSGGAGARAGSAAGGGAGAKTGAGGAGASTASGGANAGAGGQSCQDSSGFHGLGCYRCAATEIVNLENACTTATCTPFADGTRLTLLGDAGILPNLPSTSGGTGGAAGTSAAAGTSGAAGAGGSVGVGVGSACADLASKGTVVYVTGSSAAKPFLQQIAQQLVGTGIYLVYTSTGSCIGVDAVVNGTPMKTGASPAPAASATYWDTSSSSGVACDLPAAGVAADIGASDVFAQSCSGFELTDLDSLQIRDAHGPIQTMTFAVPASSAYSEISAQAAYFVFGFGKDGGVLNDSGAPIWNDESSLFVRSPSSGTQAMLAAAIGVPAGEWRGKSHKTSDDVAADLQTAGQSQDSANRALGILAADYIDSKNLRAQVHVLAFQDSSQTCAVYPDSTSGAHDKRNVRDGHYPIWGPLHLLLKVDQFGNPLNEANRQAVTDIVGYLSGTKVLPNGVQLIDVYAQSGLVPECAMHVTRTKDGGNISPYAPASPCACVFEAKATGATTCTPCKVQGDCAATQTCSQGYCEG